MDVNVMMQRTGDRGAAATPVLVFVGIVGLSVLFFFLFTLPTWLDRKSGGAAAGAKVQPVVAKVVPAVVKPRVAAAKVTYYGTPGQLLDAIGGGLAEGRVEEAMALAGPAGQEAAAQFIRHLLASGGCRVSEDAGARWRAVGMAGGMSRHALVLEPAVAGGLVVPAMPEVDLKRDAKLGWRVEAFRIPGVLAAAGLERLRGRGVLLDAEPLRAGDDALSRAADFLGAVLSRDFRKARALTNEEKVTHEKLAGLCIVFEEGEYAMDGERPLVVTAGGKGTAWAIARVRSAGKGLESEIGLEMQELADGTWRVEALDFTRMLEGYVKATKAGSVFYTPVVKSPSGGESLVVYFEFGSAALHPRALQQLEIVAALLKSDPARRLRISGHADDVGGDDMNFRLSQERAANVRKRLAGLGVRAAQVETYGFGATAPLDPNRRDDGADNPAGRSRNRRTEIYLDF